MAHDGIFTLVVEAEAGALVGGADAVVFTMGPPVVLGATVVGSIIKLYMSHHIRKPTIYICENKDADQLYSNCTADQRLCFRYKAIEG